MPTTPSPGPGLSLQQAIMEAQRCLLCHDAPCSAGCPGGTDPATFIRQIRFYNLKGAARTVRRNNPLGGVCAHVCPTSETCVAACLRVGLDRPIDIDGLQRFAVEYGRQVGLQVLSPGDQRPEKVAVIGSGPAGLTAAAKLAELGYAVTVFEARHQAGGLLRYGIPLSRLPEEALAADLGEIASLGIELRTGTTIDRATDLLDRGFAAVFVAPGLWKPLALDLPGTDLPGVTTALELLEKARTAPDEVAALVGGQNVAIIGGGSVAMDVATTVKALGAERTYAVALESMTELPALEDDLDEARQLGVIVKPQCQITRILGDGGKVAGVEGHEIEWIEPGKLVPSNARPIEGTSFRLRIGVVVQAIGQAPTETASGIVAAAAKRGALLVAHERTGATSVDRIFAGGDVARGASTVVDAVADGKRAAAAIHELLSTGVA